MLFEAGFEATSEFGLDFSFMVGVCFDAMFRIYCSLIAGLDVGCGLLVLLCYALSGFDFVEGLVAYYGS